MGHEIDRIKIEFRDHVLYCITMTQNMHKSLGEFADRTNEQDPKARAMTWINTDFDTVALTAYGKMILINLKDL